MGASDSKATKKAVGKVLSNPEETKALRALFAKVDKDDSGRISKDEFRDLASWLVGKREKAGVVIPQQASPTEVMAFADKLFAKIDTDKSGEIDFEEFVAFFQTRKGDKLKDESLKVILLGDQSVGEVYLVMKLTPKANAYNATVGIKTVSHQDTTIELELWDHRIHPEKKTMKGFYSRASGVILCYDTTKESSFHNLHKWVQEIKEYNPHSTPNVILVGLKCDAAKKAVDKQDAHDWATKKGWQAFEASSHLDTNVDSVITALTSAMINKQHLLQEHN